MKEILGDVSSVAVALFLGDRAMAPLPKATPKYAATVDTSIDIGARINIVAYVAS
jgi:hypothetical protein